jgi:hypothetical protein
MGAIEHSVPVRPEPSEHGSHSGRLNNQNSDINKDQNSDLNRDKSSSSQSTTTTTTESFTPQTPSSNPQVDQNKNMSGTSSSSTTTRSTTSTSGSASDVDQNKDVNQNPSSLPRTAGELSVLALYWIPIVDRGSRYAARCENESLTNPGPLLTAVAQILLRGVSNEQGHT